MRVIVLAAGQGFQLDGLCKCLIRNPSDGLTILQKVIAAFPGRQITVVVGYKAVAIMERYPDLDYIYNGNWPVTHNSYSLGLALTDEPCYVLSSDQIIEPPLIQEMDAAGPNIVLTHRTENRILTSLNCELQSHRIKETYVGPLRQPEDPEALGVFKISDPTLLRDWKRNCLSHGNIFAGQNLPLGDKYEPILSFDRGDHFFFEINTPQDYLRLLDSYRRAAPHASEDSFHNNRG